MIRHLILSLLIATPALAQDFTCPVRSTTDGDTFRCMGGTRVRIWGVNAPEHDEPGGPASTQALARLIGGKTLACHRKGHSYDRVVALCTLDGRDIAQTQVDRGFAVDWPKFSHGAYAAHSRGERR